MLVITRKEGERIVIDDDIVITVVEAKRGSVRIGCQWPLILETPIHPENWLFKIEESAL